MIPIGIVTDTDRSMIQSSVYNLFTITTTVTGITKHILLLPPANEVWGKVICLYLSVILFTGGDLGRYPLGRYPPGRYTPHGQVHPPGRYTFQAGTPPGQVQPPPVRYTPRQVHLSGRYTPRQCMLGYSQQAGGKHPTRMHSCY